MISPSRVGSRRILLIAEDLNPGGALLVLQRVLDFFTETGFDVIAITGTPEHISGSTRYIQVDTDARKGGWGVRGRLAEVLPARRLLARYKPELVIVHATSPGYLYAMMFAGLPVVYHLHTIIEPRRGWMRRLVYPRLRGENKRVVVGSVWQKGNVHAEWGMSDHKVQILPGYPDRRVEMRASRDIILTAGRLHWAKNPELWRDVGERLGPALHAHGLRMIWCSPLVPNRERMDPRNLPRSLEVIELPKSTQLETYLSHALLYYQPSVRETQGLAVLEAMQNGIPCVVTENTGMTDAVMDGWNGRVLPQNDAASHAEAIIDLLDNPARAAEWGSRARELIETRYTALAWKNAYRELLSSVLRSPV